MGRGLPRSLYRGRSLAPAVRKIRIPINHSISVTAVTTAAGFGTVSLGGLPEAYLKIVAVAISVQFSGPTTTNLTDTFDGDFSVGSAATTDVTLNGAEVDFISSTPLGAATAEVSPVLTVADGVSFVLDNTANNLAVNLNLLIDAADITDGATVVMRAVGVIEIVLITMLDD